MDEKLKKQCGKLRRASSDLRGILEIKDLMDRATWDRTKRVVPAADMLAHVFEVAADSIDDVEAFFIRNDEQITVDLEEEE